MKKQNFLLWTICLIICFIIQSLGNTYTPELNNLGIVIGIMFLCAYVADLYNLIFERLQK